MNFKYDKDKLLSLMYDFYILTKIKIVVFDINFNMVASVPSEDCDFCRELKKNTNESIKCENCMKEAGEICRKKNELNIYKCHAGLAEAIAPIKINDITVGFIMLGQILEQSDADSENRRNLTVKNTLEIKSAAKLMESCVCYLLMNDIITQNSDNLILDLMNYINDNLSSELTSQKLCSEFSISRNKLYKISKDYFGMPIAEFIRKKRIEYATQLIKQGTSVTTAAEMSGFCDYSYFSKVFKSYKGYSPAKSLKKHYI